MKKKIILSLLFLLSIKSNAQEKLGIDDAKFLISLHYTGNIRNENFVSDNYNGVLGIDLRYVLFKNENISLQGGLGLDYFKAREFGNQIDLKNRVIFNPNIGIELEFNKSFKPFFNLGYSFFTAKYQVQLTYLNSFDPADPGFQSVSSELKYDFNSISINPGFRLYFNQKFYAQADYKFLPIESNIDAHFIAIGLGIHF
jgi:hypothetical protein